MGLVENIYTDNCLQPIMQRETIKLTNLFSKNFQRQFSKIYIEQYGPLQLFINVKTILLPKKKKLFPSHVPQT